MKFKIPQIHWQQIPKDGWTKYKSTNTMHDYHINALDGEYLVWYKDGGHKVFDSLDKAKDWVQNTHYPAQVAKYFEVAA
ncbi:hypothetical protein LU290_03350 [Moraxella nasibovis]|uniref:hypothetical protein n=1 Tax=Moraxella nasibovis TaxID=2904120 RepID=UPI00240F22A6|nr:hypothetical protein [Moraxella nasibovis]WFF39272.1 hypothetical protein LU290_03350 [Moraxella nasibovis]